MTDSEIVAIMAAIIMSSEYDGVKAGGSRREAAINQAKKLYVETIADVREHGLHAD